MREGKAVIIAGTAGVGKTELAKRYKNVIDLESSIYTWDYPKGTDIEKAKGAPGRKINDKWPENYIKAIKEATAKYDYVCVGGNLDKNFAHYRNARFDFEIFAPAKAAIPLYIERFVARGNSREWAEKVYALYDEYLPRYQAAGKMTLLGPDETLESFLLQNSDKYPKLVPL
jgi:hypothetical protein